MNEFKVLFLGTRSINTNVKNKHHNHLTSTVIVIGKKRIFIDCGYYDKENYPDAILVTDARSFNKPLINCPIYSMNKIAGATLIHPGEKFKLFGLEILPVRVRFRKGSDTLGYKIGNIFISHNVMKIPNEDFWLSDVDTYIGDGSASLDKSKFFRRTRAFGHASINKQIFSKSDIKCYFTNCGSNVIRNHKLYSSLIENAVIAIDGMIVDV